MKWGRLSDSCAEPKEQSHNRPGPNSVRLGKRRQLPKQYGLDQKTDSPEKAVAEQEVPVASHGSHDVEAMRLHGFDYGDFFGAVLR
jgi:hypothetical protein